MDSESQDQNDNDSRITDYCAESNSNFEIQSSQECVYKETTFIDGQNGQSSSTKIFPKAPSSYDKLTPSNGESRQSNKMIKKYKNELKHILPFRTKENQSEASYASKIDEINCFQFIFFTWMGPIIQAIFANKLKLEDIERGSLYDSCLRNSRRFKKLWEKQCRKSGLHNASLESVIFKFIRTRFFVSTLFYIFCLVTGYLSSTYFVKKLLEEIEINLTINDSSLSSVDQANKSNGDHFWRSPSRQALQWTAALCMCELLRAISYSIMFAVSIRTGIRAVNSLNGAIYDKILSKRSYNTDPRSSLLQPTNLFANDLSKVFQLVYMLPLMIGSPIIILVTIVYSIYLIGHSAWVGIFLFVVIFALQFLLSKEQARLRERLMAQSDNRISLITQLMKNIRTLKFNAWEKAFQKDITYCRTAESSLIVKYQYLQCFSTSLALLTPMLITVINILMHTWLGHDLRVSTAFSLVMLNYIAAHGIRSLPNYLREIMNGRVALRRIERLLCLDDQIPYLIYELKDPTINSIEIIDASFSWATTPIEMANGKNRNSGTFVLSNINLNVRKRSHLCLYGPVGSGKSALLLSILGQTQCFKGEVRLGSSKIAYVSQNAWLQNCSIRENILFGAPFDRKRYYETMIKCQLAQDISQWRDGENTIVGENGSQLSGGQKQRIQLARALYSDSDIYLFDDFFSALDSRVVKTIFNTVIKDLLRNKTVIFVSRHLYLLSDDTPVAILHEGQIVQMDEHAGLFESDEQYRAAVERSKLITSQPSKVPSKSDKAKVTNNEQLNQVAIKRENFEANNINEDNEVDNEKIDDFNKIKSLETDISAKVQLLPGQNKQQRLNSSSFSSLISLLERCDPNNNCNYEGDNNNVETKKYMKYCKKYRQNSIMGNGKQTQQSRAVLSPSTYCDYIRASGGWIFAVMISIFALQTTASIFSSWWLSYWLRQGSGTNESITNATNGNSADSILDNPDLHFYQSVYLGLFFVVILTSLLMGCFFARIIVRAANRLHHRTLNKLIYSPLVFFENIPIGRLLNLFSHNIDELDNQLPIALDGFIQRFLLVFGTFLLIISTLNWFSIPFAIFCVLFALIYRHFRSATYWFKQADLQFRAPIYSFIQCTIDGLNTIKAFEGTERRFAEKFYSLCDRHQAANFLSRCNVRWLSIRIDILCITANMLVCVLVLLNLQAIGSAYAGLVITQSMQLSGLLQLVVRLALDLETRLISVEQIQAYIRLLQIEKSITVTTDVPKRSWNDWPKEGRISFREVSLKYRPDLPRILRGITFDIPSTTKMAIVGRTGAGKSSITYALSRLAPICGGSIFIDGVDIRSIPLEILRSRISIIPQDPVLFQGSVRKNLDPWNRTSDVDLYATLEQVNLKTKIASLKNGLDEAIVTGCDSGNFVQQFSAGEKQLLCLARALLRKSKIIVLDEATAAMDDQTETKIWNIIQTAFSDCTIILIAHWLQTVFQCNQVIIVRNGEIVERGDPIALRDDQNSLFSQMIQSINDKLI